MRTAGGRPYGIRCGGGFALLVYARFDRAVI